MKSLNDFFEKIYCINLDTRTDKWVECEKEFQNLDIKVERFSAINGNPLFKDGMNLTAGAYGLMLTHQEIMIKVALNNYKNVLILEDDVTFIDNFYTYFFDKIKSLPEDWDLLYLGGNNHFHQGQFKLVTGDPNIVVHKYNYRQLNHELCKTTWTQTTHAVSINNKAYGSVLDYIRKFNNKPIDDIFRIMQQAGYRAYTFLPSLALQRPSMSDIENRFVDYNKNYDFNF